MKLRAALQLGGRGNRGGGGLGFIKKKFNFSQELERQRAFRAGRKTSQGPPTQDSGTQLPPGATSNKLICLGKISRENPTVSHLLSASPDYQKRCWELIHAPQNRDKPYRQLAVGQAIYFDREKQEILWDCQEKARSTGRVAQSYSVVASLKVGKPGSQNTPVSMTAARANKSESKGWKQGVTAAPGSPSMPDGSQALGRELVQKLRAFIGKSYKRLNCYELVVAGLKGVGIRYEGRDGVQQSLIRRAMRQRLPLNSYFTGEGLIEASGEALFSKQFHSRRRPAGIAREIWQEIKPVLEPGLVISFSTGRRGHTGVVARYRGHWTLINSGFMDNDLHSPVRQKRVGEEKLMQEILNWSRLAHSRRQPLNLTLGRIDKNKAAGAVEDNV
ncbi:hypothetical protein [Desulfoferrobacter suflitae]|uniref:hypothetical protein n=1 Tax=Desulfoferrobacter suflitae TaxID=2865782 RepID=UPI0021646B17|nr:hypothetical protein [Desulfoferrobacter suflitae]MCK8602405.1 hypothetical protein [Desulfoferrobacter suflitae]